MIKRKLGQGFEVSALSLGAMGYLGQGPVIPDRPEMIAMLRTRAHGVKLSDVLRLEMEASE